MSTKAQRTKKIANASRTKTMADREKEWEAESALSTLERAEEIRQNPDLMKRVGRIANEKAVRFKSLASKYAKGGRKK